MILAHELCHHVKNHIWVGIGLQTVLTYAGFFLTQLLLAYFTASPQFSGVADIAGLPILILISTTLSLLVLSESYLAGGSAQMDKVLTQIADELRSQYTLGFYRTTPDDGQFHRVRIKSRHGHIVRARRGYLAVR